MPASTLLFGTIIMSEMWWDVRMCWEIHFRLWFRNGLRGLKSLQQLTRVNVLEWRGKRETQNTMCQDNTPN